MPLPWLPTSGLMMKVGFYPFSLFLSWNLLRMKMSWGSRNVKGKKAYDYGKTFCILLRFLARRAFLES